MSKINKKGFTLVEIIITLAIVVTITTVAVGSYIGISNNKKKEEWKLVKDQIETAAEQYFSSNKYLYEGLTDNVQAYISVGTLVHNDYLDKVVNPITKKEVSECSIVTVTIKNNKYTGTYDENNKINNCNTDGSNNPSNDPNDNSTNKIIVKEKDSTSGSIHYYNKDGNELDNNNWFNIDDLGESTPNSENNDTDLTGKVLACIDVIDSEANKDAAGAVIYGVPINEKIDGKGFCKLLPNGTDRDISFKLINSSGRTYQETEWVGVDTTRPVGEVEITSAATTGYNSNVTNVRVHASDETSKFGSVEVVQENLEEDDPLGLNDSFNELDEYNETVYKYQIASSLDGKTYKIILNMTDLAGNEGTAEDSYTVYEEYSNLCVGGSDHSSGGRSCTYDKKGNRTGGGYSDTSYSLYYDTFTGSYYYRSQYAYKSCGCSTCRASDPVIDCPNNRDVPKTTTTKPKTNTKAVCTRFKEATTKNIGDLIKVSVSGNKLLDKDIYDVQSDKSKNRVTFKFDGKSDGNKIKFNDDVAAVWTSGDSAIEKTEWHNGWNSSSTKSGKVTKNTWCVTKYDCSTKNHSKFYVTACAYAKCGSTTKKICYSAYVTRNSKAAEKGFTYVGN